MVKSKDKPQGASGAIRVGSGETEWVVIPFPGPKGEREQLIAQLFVDGFGHYVAMQSEPSLAPFGPPRQNKENDLDFTVMSAQGEKLMELAEFAPLQTHGPKFDNAPKALDPKEKAALALELIKDKSAHQGGADRILAIYITEHGFWLDPITIERLRRLLTNNPPNFDRVYYVSPHDLISASVSEIFPGKPHHNFGEYTDEELDRVRTYLPHPTEMVVGHTAEWSGVVGVNRKPVPAQFKIDVSGIRPIKRGTAQSIEAPANNSTVATGDDHVIKDAVPLQPELSSLPRQTTYLVIPAVAGPATKRLLSTLHEDLEIQDYPEVDGDVAFALTYPVAYETEQGFGKRLSEIAKLMGGRRELPPKFQ